MAEFLKSKLPKSSQTKSKSLFYGWLNKVMFILMFNVNVHLNVFLIICHCLCFKYFKNMKYYRQSWQPLLAVNICF